MLDDALWLCAALAIAFVINLAPAFMPSTWMVLSFFRIKFGLPLLLLTFGGVIASALGRLLLAKGSTIFKRRFLKGKESDLQELGNFLKQHRNSVGLSTFLYTLTPLPSNNLFIAAGMVEVNMRWVLVGFLCGRLLADTFYVWTTNRVFSDLGPLFKDTLGNWWGIILQVASVASIVLLYKLPWARWLRRYIDKNGAH